MLELLAYVALTLILAWSWGYSTERHHPGFGSRWYQEWAQFGPFVALGFVIAIGVWFSLWYALATLTAGWLLLCHGAWLARRRRPLRNLSASHDASRN